MNIDKIEYVGLINNTPNDKHNIFIFDNSMFEIYNDLYKIDIWPSVTVDLIENKLLGGNMVSFHDIIVWMKRWEINCNNPQYVIVKKNTGLYTIYCNYHEALIYFRNRILKIPVSMISITISHYDKYHKYTTYLRNDYSITNLYKDTSIWRSIKLYNKIQKFLDIQSINSIYNYSYLQQQMTTNHSRNTWFQEHRFIIENDNSIILSQLQKFQKHANKISEEMRSPDIIENINIYLGELSYNFNEKTENII